MTECTRSVTAERRTRPVIPDAGNLMAVVAHYQGALLRYVGRMLGGAGDQSEDVVQETFVRLHRQVCAHGSGSVRHLTTWLFQVAHNLTLDVLRKKVRQDSVQAEVVPAAAAQEPAAEDLDALGEVIRRETRHVALRELGQLDDAYRQVILLKVVQGMTLRQVAEVVGVSISTVNSRLNEGLSMLARRLRRAGVV